jgi:hypothetical protein
MKVAEKLDLIEIKQNEIEDSVKDNAQRISEIQKNQKGIVVNIEETTRIDAILTLAETVKILAEQLNGTKIIVSGAYISGCNGNGLTIQTTPYTKEEQ